MKPPRNALDEIAAAASGRARRGHSQVYWFIFDQFRLLKREKLGKPDWQYVTDQLNALGLRDARGKPLQKENVRKTWERAAKDYAALSAPASKPIKPESPPIRSLISISDDDDEPEFRTVTGEPVGGKRQ